MSRLRSELEVSLNDKKSIANAYYGCYFEQIVHQTFRKGGTFRVRALESSDKRINLIENFTRQDDILRFSKVESIEDGKYYQPESRTFPSIDAIIAPDRLYQITIAEKHPIKLTGLNLLFEKLSKDSEISYYFVVPSKLYDSYRKQDFVTAQGTIVKRLPSWVRKYVKQYVLEVDLSSGGSISRTSSTATIEHGISNLLTDETQPIVGTSAVTVKKQSVKTPTTKKQGKGKRN